MKADYDAKNDMLSFKFRDVKYRFSRAVGDVIVDLDMKGNIMGMQMMDASEYLGMNEKEIVKVVKNINRRKG